MDLEILQQYRDADQEFHAYLARFFAFGSDPSDEPLEPVGPEEIAEMARLRQAADDAWTEFMASATPGEEELAAS
jgi:hypothetical protein